MKVKMSLILLIATLQVMSPGWSWSQTESDLIAEASHINALAATKGEKTVVTMLVAQFESVLEESSEAVISGLRNGTSITLTSTAPPTFPGEAPVTTTTVINPPTTKMGYGNVFITLALAKEQLGQVGISQPTPSELEAVLLGGTITISSGTDATATQFQGILTMRADGTGWGQIAHKLGFTLGDVISSIKSASHNQAIRTTTSSTSGIVNAGGQPAEGVGKGVVSGSGKSFGKSEGKALGKGIVDASGHPAGTGHGPAGYGRGIVDGSGQVMGGSGGVHGHGYGRGIVSGSGRPIGRGHGYGLSTNPGRGKSHSK